MNFWALDLGCKAWDLGLRVQNVGSGVESSGSSAWAWCLGGQELFNELRRIIHWTLMLWSHRLTTRFRSCFRGMAEVFCKGCIGILRENDGCLGSWFIVVEELRLKCNLMLRTYSPKLLAGLGLRVDGLGWDKKSPYPGLRCNINSNNNVTHNGSDDSKWLFHCSCWVLRPITMFSGTQYSSGYKHICYLAHHLPQVMTTAVQTREDILGNLEVGA